MTTQQTVHRSVLLDEVKEFIAPVKSNVILDATLGGAGHTEAFLETGATVVSIDADPGALARARERLARFGSRAILVQGNFRDVCTLLSSLGISSLSHALFDLGLSSDQLEVSGRGFSFMRNEPLRMTFGEDSLLGFDAKDLLNTWSEEGIANVLWGYGEERYARRIARAVVEERKKNPIETTEQLVALINRSTPLLYRKGKTHPATKTFQALRIAVNDELGAIEKGLEGAVSLLSKGGRIAVISFHSIEDRAVKHALKALAERGSVSIITKKPVTASLEERHSNPRARSAKLRVAEKI